MSLLDTLKSYRADAQHSRDAAQNSGAQDNYYLYRGRVEAFDSVIQLLEQQPLAGGARLRELLESLEDAINATFSGSAEDGSFIRRSGAEWVPSVFLTLKELRREIKALEDAAALLVPPTDADLRLVLDAAKQYADDPVRWKPVSGAAYFEANLNRHENRRKLWEAVERLTSSLVPSSSPAPQERWQPIETAPRENTEFIALRPNGDVFLCHWCEHFPSHGWATKECFIAGGSYEPKAWMPNPPVSGSTATPGETKRDGQ